MGINDLQLSPELIAALYPETLVIAGNPAPVVYPAGPEKIQSVKTSTYSFFGKNQRSITVLVSAPHHEFMPEEQIAFLKKILEACKYGMDDIAIINIHHQMVDMGSLRNQFKPRIVFLWGSLPDIPGLQNPLPDLSVSILGDITVLPVARPELMSRNDTESQELKRVLWTSLKKIFNL